MKSSLPNPPRVFVVSSTAAGEWLLGNTPSAPQRTATEDISSTDQITDPDPTVTFTRGNNLELYRPLSRTSSDLNVTYHNILSRQFQRAQSFIHNEIKKLEWDDDDKNSTVLERIADAIDLVGEPALCAAYVQLLANITRRFPLEKLLQALAAGHDSDTEKTRAEVIERFCYAQDPAVRYTAVEALGGMASHSHIARELIKKLSETETNKQIVSIARAYTR